MNMLDIADCLTCLVFIFYINGSGWDQTHNSFNTDVVC